MVASSRFLATQQLSFHSDHCSPKAQPAILAWSSSASAVLWWVWLAVASAPCTTSLQGFHSDWETQPLQEEKTSTLLTWLPGYAGPHRKACHLHSWECHPAPPLRAEAVSAGGGGDAPVSCPRQRWECVPLWQGSGHPLPLSNGLLKPAWRRNAEPSFLLHLQTYTEQGNSICAGMRTCDTLKTEMPKAVLFSTVLGKPKEFINSRP